MAGVVRCGVRIGEAEGVTVTDGIGGEVGMSAAGAIPPRPTTLAPPPRGERRLPMVILLGETIVILLALVLLLELWLHAPKRLVDTTPLVEVKVILSLAGEEEEEGEEREEGDCCCVEDGGLCGLVCVPVEAFEADAVFVGLSTPPSCLILIPEEAEGEIPFICGNPVVEEPLAGEWAPFIC